MNTQYFELSCRKAAFSDPVEKIAEYIHLTDAYIYPKICDSSKDKNWCDFIRACIQAPSNLYHRDHLVVLLRNDEIVGLACVIPCGQTYTITDGISLPASFSQKLAPVIHGYFQPLIDETQTFTGYNIINFCIDSRYHNMGYGKKLMEYCIELYGRQDVHLDVVADNAPALTLYEGFGFQKESLYMGYSGNDKLLPCYHMIRQDGV